MMETVHRLLERSLNMFLTGDMSDKGLVEELENKTDALVLDITDRHLQRMADGKCDVHAGVFFSDMINGLERVGDHATNIAFALYKAKMLTQKRSGSMEPAMA